MLIIIVRARNIPLRCFSSIAVSSVPKCANAGLPIVIITNGRRWSCSWMAARVSRYCNAHGVQRQQVAPRRSMNLRRRKRARWHSGCVAREKSSKSIAWRRRCGGSSCCQWIWCLASARPFGWYGIIFSSFASNLVLKHYGRVHNWNKRVNLWFLFS